MTYIDAQRPLATEVSPRIRFAAVDRARTLSYDGPRNLRWAIESAWTVEGFAHAYPEPLVAAAVVLLRAAAGEDGYDLDGAHEDLLAALAESDR